LGSAAAGEEEADEEAAEEEAAGLDDAGAVAEATGEAASLDECAVGAAVQHEGCAAGEGELPGEVEQHEGGAAGRGAETPATLEPSPMRCSVGASSFPLGSRPCADWNFSSEVIVVASIFPVGSPE